MASRARTTKPRLAAAAAILLLIVGGTWLIASRQQSARQAAATASAPPDTPVLVAVERRQLEKALVFRCSGRTPHQTVVGAPMLPDGFLPVVTKIGLGSSGEVREGAVVFEISHRPIIVLQGEVPAYRSINPGDTGRDVLQLQRALTRLGLRPELDGAYGPSTQTALRQLYESKGYSPIYMNEAASRGPRVPLGEVLFVPVFPAYGKPLVNKTQQVDGPLAELSAGEIIIRGAVPIVDGSALRGGQSVTVSNDLAGSSFEGKISSIGRPASIEAFGQGRRVTINPLRPAPVSTLGADLRCSSVLARTDESALVVPITAVLSDSSGETYVLVWESARARRVSVAVGLSASTYVEIVPEGPGEIERGDLVLVDG